MNCSGEGAVGGGEDGAKGGEGGPRGGEGGAAGTKGGEGGPRGGEGCIEIGAEGACCDVNNPPAKAACMGSFEAASVSSN